MNCGEDEYGYDEEDEDGYGTRQNTCNYSRQVIQQM